MRHFFHCHHYYNYYLLLRLGCFALLFVTCHSSPQQLQQKATSHEASLYSKQLQQASLSKQQQQRKETMSTTNYLAGKLALITGGSGTIGQAIAKALLNNGVEKVVLTGRSLQKLQKAHETTLDNSPRVSLISSDVTNETSVVELFERIKQENNQQTVDLLINNAGTMAPGKTVDLSADDFDRVMKVNVLGPFLCAREAMKQMKDNGGSGGRIINIGSISAYAPRFDGAPYTTSKFALQGLSRSLAMDGRQDNIAVGIIHPGNVESDLLTPEVIEERSKTEGFMSAESVANCVVTMANMPYHTNVLELTVIPTKQPLVGRG